MIDLNKYIPIESTQYPGFYIIPGIKDYVTNIFGNVKQLFDSRDIKTGDIITNTLTKRGYLTNGIRFNNGKYKNYSNHRLVCLAFYGPPKPKQKHCNHKDGIRDNNYFKNVEWCTPLENIQHAWDNGLSAGKVVYVWDTISDPDRCNIKLYSTITAAAMDMGIPTNSLHNSLLNESKRLYLKRYVAKYIDDIAPWPSLDTIRKNSKTVVISAKNMDTGEIYKATSIIELSLLIKINENCISRAIKRNIPSSHGIWLYAYGNADIDWDKLEQHYHESNPNVVLYNIVTDEKFIYNDLRQLAYMNNFTYMSIHRCLKIKHYTYQNYLLYSLTDMSDKLKLLKQQYGLE